MFVAARYHQYHVINESLLGLTYFSIIITRLSYIVSVKASKVQWRRWFVSTERVWSAEMRRSGLGQVKGGSTEDESSNLMD